MQRNKHKLIKKKQMSVNQNGIVRSLLMGLVYGYFFTAMCMILMAFMLTYTGLFTTENQTTIAIIIVTIIAVLITGFMTSKGYGKDGLMWGAVSGLCYLVILVVLSLVLDKDLSLKGNLFSTLLICLTGGTLGGVLGNKKK